LGGQSDPVRQCAPGAIPADRRQSQRPVVRRGPTLRSRYLRGPADGQRQRPAAGRPARQPAGRVRRALVLAGRAHAEYADTACDFPTSPPEFGCAYTSGIYTSGYRYRGRALGHTIDADGESIGVGLLLVEASGDRWSLLARNVKLNRAGVAAEHSLAGGAATVVDVTLSHGRTLAWGNIGVLLGYADASGGNAVAMEDGARASLTWRYDLR